jgi:site-specific DNA-methyltransferase (adenine-specific)
MAVRIEDAGFEIRDQIMWVYGSGFPKSHNIGKAIDKIEGNDREVVGHNPNHRNTESDVIPLGFQGGRSDGTITKGNSDWEGWGTALKPAHEPIVMARKPLTEKSIAENVLKYGTGGINIDGSRIGFRDEADKESAKPGSLNATGEHSMFGLKSGNELNDGGRFPANIIFDEEAGQLLDEQSGERGNGWKKNYGKEDYEGLQYSSSTQQCVFGGGYNGKNTYSDKGGASRFFYCPKTSKSDRNEGLIVEKEKNKRPIGVAFNNEDDLFQQGNGNNHPTVKPTDLMRYLINLITPPNGTTLDPFMGSGSTGKAAIRCGVNFIGIEKEQEYMDIASARIQHEQNKPVQQSLF